MPKKSSKSDPNQTAAKLVQSATGTNKVRGESLLGSPELKRRFREMKKAAKIKKHP